MQMLPSKILYVGLDPSRYPRPVVHCPVIQIYPYALPAIDWPAVTHVIYTSRVAAQLLPKPEGKCVIAVGKATAEALGGADYVACDERAEGVVALLESLALNKAHVLYPHSARSRPLIRDYLEEKHIPHTAFALYETRPRPEAVLPDLDAFDEIVFTSPSTVEAFVALCGTLPAKRLTAIGPVTEKALEKFRAISYREPKNRGDSP